MVELTYTAPAALVAHCVRSSSTKRAPSSGVTGERDRGDVAGLIAWLNERDEFSTHDAWVSLGMALKLEYGDDGIGLWQLTHDDTVSADVEESKWQSFATEPTAQSVTLATFLDRAHKLGWRGSVRKSTSAMFGGVDHVAALAAATGANTQATTQDALFAGQAELTRLASPYLVDFLAATTDAPARAKHADDFPMLPPNMDGHGLFELMNASLARIAAMIEPDCSVKFKGSRVVDPLGVLGAMNLPDLYGSVTRRITNMGHTLPTRKIKLFAEGLTEAVQRVTVTLDKWELDPRTGEPQSDNSDNVQVALGILGLSIRWNAWLERMEIQGGNDDGLRWAEWTYIDDSVVAKIRTRLNRTKTRFRPGKDFLWESLLTLSHLNTVDPVLDTLADLQRTWDGVPRLSRWLSTYCGTPQDAYYAAVSANIIGGMVLRARHAGIKFDTMAVLYGRQGTGKSSLAAILALDPEWFTDSILLGDASKELVLSLAGKLVVEIGEMGMRGNTDANHVKAMISRQVDEGRTAYARAVTRRPRRNVFLGTTNDDEPLQDPTGNRRFLAVRVDGEIALDALRRDISQLIGEAATLEAAGADFAIPKDVWALQAAYQEAARAICPVEELCQEWFDRPAATYGFYITATDVNRALRMAGQSGRYSTHLKRMGWRNENLIVPGVGRKARVWVRHVTDKLVECARLVPQQTQVNGPVEMRLSSFGAAAPPVPY
jgi:predicted P-loop ATPase